MVFGVWNYTYMAILLIIKIYPFYYTLVISIDIIKLFNIHKLISREIHVSYLLIF